MAAGRGGWLPPRPPPGFNTAVPPPQKSYPFLIQLPVYIYIGNGHNCIQSQQYEDIFKNCRNFIKEVLESKLNIQMISIMNSQVSCMVTSLEQLKELDYRYQYQRHEMSKVFTQLLVKNGLPTLLQTDPMSIFCDVYIDPMVFVLGKLHYGELGNLGPPPLGKVNAAEGEKIATDSRDTKGKENANFPEYPKQKHDQSYAEETYHDAQETTPEAANLQESVAPSSSVHSIKVERSYIDLEEHRRLSKKESGSKEVNYTAQNIKREPVSDQEFVFSQHDSNKSTEKEQISKTSHETTTQNGHATNISDVKNKTEEQAGSSSEKTYAAAIKTGVTCTSERDNRVLKVQETVFMLYIPEQFEEVVEVTLKSDNNETLQKRNLHYDEKDKLWRSETIRLPLNAGVDPRYKYSIKSKAGFITKVVTLGLVDKNKVTEGVWRHLKVCPAQKDIFCSEDSLDRRQIADGVWCFTRITLQQVTAKTMKDKILECCDMPLFSKLKKCETSQQIFTTSCIKAVQKQALNTEQQLFLMILVLHAFHPLEYIIEKHVMFSSNIAMNCLKILQMSHNNMLPKETQEVLADYAPLLFRKAYETRSVAVCPVRAILFYYPGVEENIMISMLGKARRTVLATEEEIKETILKLVNLLQQEKGCSKLFNQVMRYSEDATFMIELHKTVVKTVKAKDYLTDDMRCDIISCIERRIESSFGKEIGSCDITKLDHLKHVLQQVSEYEKFEAISGKLEQQILVIVKRRTNKWDEKSLELLHDLLASESLFLLESFVGVMHDLLKVRDDHVVNFLPILMKSAKFKVAIQQEDFDMKRFALDVLKQKVCALEASDRGRSDRNVRQHQIQEVYKLLDTLCQVEVVDEVSAKASKEFVCKWLFSHDLKFIMDCEYSFRDDMNLTLYQEHQRLYIETTIKESDRHQFMRSIYRVLGKNLKLTHSNVGTIVMFLNHNAGHTYAKTDVVIKSTEAVRQIFKEMEFWRMIFSATGVQVQRVLEHQSTQNVLNVLKMIGERMKSKTLPYSQCKLVTDFITDKPEDCEEVFHHALKWKRNKLSKVTEALTEECKQLESQMNDSLKILKMVKDISSRMKLEVSDIDDKIEIISMAQTSAETLETPLDKLLLQQTCIQEMCSSEVREKQLLEAIKIKTFTDLMLRALETDRDSLIEKVETLGLSLLFSENIGMEEQDTTSTEKIVKYLCRVCLPEFEELVKAFFYSDGQRSVHEMVKTFKSELQEKELRKIESFIGKEMPNSVKCGLRYIKEFEGTKAKAETLNRICGVFDIVAQKDTSDLQKALVDVQQIDGKLQIPLAKFHEVVDVFRSRTKGVEDLDWHILHELCQAKNLISFMRTVIDDDLRNLIDAVEEHSEQYVEESTVSGLIQVKKFLYPVLSKPLKNSVSEFMKQFHRCKSDNKQLVALQLNGCKCNLHQLRVLYNSVANRGEVTKEIVTNIVQKGVVWFSINPGKENTFVQVKKGKKTARYQLHDLEDLRSRSLLIIYNDREKKEEKANDMKQFIEMTDLIREIWELLRDLHRQGHFDYKEYEWKSSKQAGKPKQGELQTLKDHLVGVQHQWSSDLEAARKQFYYLNFVHSEQLWLLQDYFQNKNPALQEKALSLLRYINPAITTVEGISSRLSCEQEAFENKLDGLGHCLNVTGIQESAAQPLPLPTDLGKNAIPLEACVQPGELFVAHIDVTYRNPVPVLLALYCRTVARLPFPFEVLFCCSTTTAEQIELLLNRCFYNPRRNETVHLFTIVNVETLLYEVRELLVQKLRNICNSNDSDVLLALTCTANAFHPVLVEFSRYVHKIPGLERLTMEHLFQSICPNACMITSEVPGLGKSELIFEKAAELTKTVHTINISGPVLKSDLALQLSEISHTDNVVHFNIGLVDDPMTLDIFLFELIFLKCAVSDTVCVQVPSDFVAIEVANSLQHKLRDDLFLMSCLKREHLTWTHFQDLIVSPEITSPVQIVCHYLQVKQNGTLGSKDLLFRGSNIVPPLSSKECQGLLSSCLGDSTDLSYSILNIFLNVLADQLLKLSNSQYFRVSNLATMLKDKSTGAYAVRTHLVDALITMAKEFACRSIQSCRSQQADALKEQVDGETGAMLSRVDRMVKWTDSNHFVVLFQSQNIQAVTPLYRTVSAVDIGIKSLFDSQLRKPLVDYKGKPQTELQHILEQLVCKKKVQNKQPEFLALMERYALTSDNLLKMILIMLRLHNRVPVLLMGETGCGKTSLIRYLAMTCHAQLELYSIHAGISRKDIINRIEMVNKDAYQNPNKDVWLFLDEINTCDHLGIISNILCERKISGMRLAPNLACLAACNPYRLRNMERAYTAGLGGKKSSDEYSQLVYRVYPLPENLVDYVWDYGSLDSDDEKEYIACMLRSFDSSVSPDLKQSFVKVLQQSQHFIRQVEDNAWCVSLRDVDRCKTLVRWFMEMLKTKNKYPLEQHSDEQSDDDVAFKSLLLALSICYEVRLQTAEERQQYWESISCEFSNLGLNKDVLGIQRLVRAEQLDILNRMDIPDGIAKNTALRENVFVLFVCILNRIPIFLVGKPGCSKSLSMQLLKSNLRGLDSSDPYFQTLPHIYVVAYQGSEASTSEGIIKIFEKAENYQKKRSGEENILPVVLLDEIGLAEISQNNPLKVLHGLLEPNTASYPDVSVVGISNWALDSAKMNRAIHLSRPDLSREELYDTGESISMDFAKSASGVSLIINNEILYQLAEAYFEYYHHQKLSNFHGLRDYYSLIKYIAKQFVNNNAHSMSKNEELQVIHRGLLRNFGGLPSEFGNILISFLKGHDDVCVPTVQELVRENIEDKESRHLLLITRGDSVISLLTALFESLGRDYTVIYGSSFEDDKREEYNYQVLSRIIHCMEQGVVLILKDLDEIYGSLYDMLNQNYTIVGKRRNCRIAHGAHSNPMCPVHDDFRCIVLIDEDKIDYSDPPFLNRFEKQVLNFQDMLQVDEHEIVQTLQEWVKRVSEIPGYSFAETDAFLGYHEDTLVSLIKELPNKEMLASTEETRHSIEDMCKLTLLLTCPSDAIMRLYACDIPGRDDLVQDYLQLPLCKGLKSTLDEILSGKLDVVSSERCKKMICYTYSNIHCDVASLLSLSQDDIIHLGSVKSEKHLTTKISSFFSKSSSGPLVIQCHVTSDAQHLLVAKLEMEQQRSKYLSRCSKGNKHMLIIVHIDRMEKVGCHILHLNYSGGWIIFAVDALDMRDHHILPNTNEMGLQSMLGMTPPQLLQTTFCEIVDCLTRHLFWAFSCLQYQSKERQPERVKFVISGMKKRGNIMERIADTILKLLNRDDASNLDNDHWQVQVACNKQILLEEGSMVKAWRKYLDDLVKCPLANIIWKVEKCDAWGSIIQSTEDSKLSDIWFHQFERICSEDMLDEKVSGLFSLEVPGPILDTKFPFIRMFVENIRHLFEIILLDIQMADGTIESMSEIESEDQFKLLSKYCSVVENHIIDVYGDTDVLDGHWEMFATGLCEEISWFPEIEINTEHRGLFCRLFFDSRVQDLGVLEHIVHLTSYIVTFALEQQLLLTLLKLLSMCKNSIVEDVMTKVVKFSNEQRGKDGEIGFKVETSDVEELTKSDEECSAESLSEGEPTASDNMESMEELVAHTVIIHALPIGGNLDENCDAWAENSRTIMAYCNQLGCETDSLHVLRFCFDLYKMFIQDGTLAQNCLCHFAELALCSDASVSLVADPVFEYMSHEIQEKVPKGQEMKLQKLTCLYLARCLQFSNNSGDVVQRVLSIVVDNKLPNKTLDFCGPILQCMFFDLDDIISENRHLEVSENTQELETLALLDNGFCEYEGCSLFRLCESILVQKFVHCFAKEMGRMKIETHLDAFTKVVAKKQEVDSKAPVFFSSYSTAFIMFYVAVVAEHVTTTGMSSEISPFQKIDGLLSSFESIDSVGVSAFTLHLLNKLKKGSLKELKTLCQELQKALPSLKSIVWPKDDVSMGVGFNILSLSPACSDFKNAFHEMPKDKSLKDLMKQAQEDVSLQQGLMACTADQLYWPRYNHVQKDTEKSLAEWLSGNYKSYDEHIKEVLLCLTGRKDFNVSWMNISQQHNYTEVLISSVLLHIVQAFLPALTCKNPCSLVKCCTAPKSIDSKTFMYKRGSQSKGGQPVHVYSCHSDHYIVTKKQIDTCTTCGTSELTPVSLKDSYSEEDIDISCATLFKGNLKGHTVMEDIVYLLYEAFLLAGCSHGNLDEKCDLTQLMPTFKQRWNSIRMRLDESELRYTFKLHKIISDIRNMVYDTSENQLSDYMAHVIETDLLISEEDLNDFKEKVYLASTGKTECFLSDKALPPESRSSKIPTVTHMKGVLAVQTKSSRNYPFLSLLLQSETCVQTVKCLYPLLIWQKIVHNMSNHQLTRSESRTQDVQTFIQTSKRKDELKDHFEAFVQSLSTLQGLCADPVVGNWIKGIDIPKLDLSSPISWCIVDSENHFLVDVITCLIGIQNQFLFDCARLALDKCPSLAFMVEKGVVSIQTVSVSNMKEKHIIDIAWPEKLLRFAQNNVHDGCEQGIEYDFDEIEKELAQKLVLGKLGLRYVSLRTVFKNEMFHWCSHILSDFKKYVPQSHITRDMKTAFRDAKAENPQDIRGCLDFLEIVIALVQKTRGLKLEKPLLYFAETWEIDLDKIKSKGILFHLKNKLTLAHVVSLYEFLEEELSEFVTESIPELYSKPLPPSSRIDLEQFMKHEYVPVESLGTAIKRLVVRYLSHDDMTRQSLPPALPLETFICEPNMWSQGVDDKGCLTCTKEVKGMKLSDLFPKSLYLEHVKCTWEMVNQQIQKNKRKVETRPKSTLELKKKKPQGKKKGFFNAW